MLIVLAIIEVAQNIHERKQRHHHRLIDQPPSHCGATHLRMEETRKRKSDGMSGQGANARKTKVDDCFVHYPGLSFVVYLAMGIAD